MSEDLSQELGRNIPLFEMIQSLRTELQASRQVAKDQSLRFEVEEVELELRVQVTRSGGANGKLHFGVLEAGATRTRSQDDVHIFKLKLKPVSPEKAPVLVADEASALPRQPGG
jgi:hypothetical protein